MKDIFAQKTDFTDLDRAIWEEELEDFLPSVIYDMHSHLWSETHKANLKGPPTGLRWEVSYDDLMDWSASLYPGREMHFLVLGTPIPGMDIAGHNAWVASQMSGDPNSGVNLLVTPEMTPEYVAEQVRIHKFFGLKPYRLFAPDLLYRPLSACFIVIEPEIILPGSFDPLFNFAACLIK